MALRQMKHKYKGHKAFDAPSLIKPYNKSDITSRPAMVLISDNQSMEFINNKAYQQNIVVDNREIPRLIQRSKPAYVQNTDFLKPITIRLDPEDKYVNYRI